LYIEKAHFMKSGSGRLEYGHEMWQAVVFHLVHVGVYVTFKWPTVKYCLLFSLAE